MNTASTYIELGRKFAEYLVVDTPEALAQRSYTMGFLGQDDGKSWDELLQHRLVVILGEPGSGKTSELRGQQVRQLSSSFFLELNQLVKEQLPDILDDAENSRFSRWRSGHGDATFFLDAVDESKLVRNDDFFIALDRVKKAIGPALARARFVISSRISEWRPEIDSAGVLQRLGIDGVVNKVGETTGMQIGRDFQQNSSTSQAEEERPSAILVVTLQPLTPSQVERYARAKGVNNPQEFIEALEEGNAWAFAGRPLDVEFLYGYWNEKRHLGNLTALSEYMITKLLAEVPNRNKQDVLTPVLAREGVEYLAAAAVLCRRLKFRMSDAAEVAGESVLIPADVLPEFWLPKDMLALMDRALFDAATHGAMSFHHRYHTEYLAASWIARLMDHNCKMDALEDLLFATLVGQRVMRPSLKPVAAWLVAEGEEPWRLRLAEWILESCPEIHLVHGDPATLPLEYRRKVLRNLVERYKGRHYVHLNMNRAALTRFANAGLADEINTYLVDKTIAEDLRVDFLLVVRDGKLDRCIPTALAIFADPSASDDLRSYVATVIRDAGDDNHRQQLAQLWQALPEISNTLLARLCEALFPQTIDADGLLALIRRSGMVAEHSVDLPYYLGNLLKETLDAAKAEVLLRGILELLATPPLSREPAFSNHFFWTSNLIPICLQRLLTEANLSREVQGLVISAVFVLEQIGHHGDSYRLSSDRQNEQSVQQMISIHDGLRRALFWARVARYRSKHKREPSRFELDGYGAEVKLVPEDLVWLLSDAASDLPLEDRRFALNIAADRVGGQQSLLISVWKLLLCTKGNPELLAICRQYVWGRLSAPFVRVWYRHFRHRLLERYWWSNRLRHLQKRYTKIRDYWWLWRHLDDLRKGLHPYTLAHFARDAGGDRSSQYGGSDWGKVEKEWGKTISNAAQLGCVAGWRQFAPSLPHEKQERNSVDNRLFVGLTGLQTLWRGGRLDFGALSADEVDLLVRYACSELNGFPEWFPYLLGVRPEDVVRTLGRAVAGEWGYPREMEHVHDVVAKLAWMPEPSPVLARLILSRLLVSDPQNQRMLEYALAVIVRSSESAAADLCDIARERVVTYTTEQPQWLYWMNIWLQLDAFPALDYLESVLSDAGEMADDLAIRLCGVMYGRHDEQRQISNPSYHKPRSLVRLIPLVYRYVRESEDIHREGQGVYSPGPRDHAQRFRSRLLEILGASKEPDADATLRALVDVPVLNESRDWILHLLDERKYLLVDDAPWQPEDVRVFAKKYRSEPRSDFQLFRLIVRLLEDIKSHVERSESAANRLAVRSGDLEKDFRGYLYGELSERSLKWFSVTQESEVDLGQCPDIRVERIGLNPLPIEIKLANLKHWTLEKLLERLENQLVGQYLRPVNVNHGIYVLGNTEPKRRWELPGTKKLIDFQTLVSLIQNRAAELQKERRADVDGIEVIGIDFSDPRTR